MRRLTLLLLVFCVFVPMSEARPAHFGPYYQNTKHVKKPKKQKKYKASAAHKARRSQFKKKK